MLLRQNFSRKDRRLVNGVLAAFLSLLLLHSDAGLVRVFAFKVVVCSLDAALGSLLLLFEFLQHGLNPLMLIVRVSCLLGIVLPYLFVAF